MIQTIKSLEIQTKPTLTRLSLNAKLVAISYLIELKFAIYAKKYLPNGLQHQIPNQTISKYEVIWSQYVHFVTTLQLHLTK